ncbi:hypothetical protein Tco_1300921 [Tanacetum coccineum]
MGLKFTGCDNDALRKIPHDDHHDDDQHEGEKAKRLRTTSEFSSKPFGKTNTKKVNVKRSGDKEVVKADMENGRTRGVHERKFVVMRVEDFWLGIKSYQFKLNMIRPLLIVPGIEAMEPYTTITAPIFGVIYDNDSSKTRFMAMDEVIKFSKAP